MSELRLARPHRAWLCVAFAVVVGCGNRTTEPAQRAVAQQSGPQSTIVGPFVNDPVAPPSTVAALPTTASNAPLLRAPDNSNSNSNSNSSSSSSTGTTEPVEPVAEAPTPTPTPTNETPGDRDALLDGLNGVWADGPTRTSREGNGYVISECVLTIRSPTDAREECTTTTRYGDREVDRCNQSATTRVWITASPYTLSASNGNVTFTPGEVELVRDDEGRCQFRAAGQHTTMVTQGWTGRGDVISAQNTRADGTTQGSATYHRRSRATRR